MSPFAFPTYGDPVTFTASLTSAGGAPTGNVQFQIDGTNYGSPVVLTNGSASISTAALHAGAHNVEAFYTSDTGLFSNSDDSASPWQQTVNQATPTLTWANPSDIIYGSALDGTQLDASANVAGSFAYSPAAGTVLHAGQNQTLSVTFTPSDSTDYTTATGSATMNVAQAVPVITWFNPSDITFGTALGSTQLDASANVPGSFVYSPAPGTVLNAGQNQTLSVTFTPRDATDYTTATNTVSINVNQATPVVTWANPNDITFGTTLNGTQLDATANVPGNFVYSPAAGTVLSAGQNQTLSATFTPSDATDYKTTTATAAINVNQATPIITWANPSDITFGAALGGTQLAATANVPGTFVYSPAAGTVLSAGQNQTLSVTFTPSDATDYKTTAATAAINVNQATPVLTWAHPSDITYGTALSGTQLDATANVPGSFAYNPAAGTVLAIGQGQTLNVTFTPSDTTDYKTTTATATISVARAAQVITWAYPGEITYGTALSNTQLDATANVPGAFVYTPPAGTMLNAAQGQTLNVAFVPMDGADYTAPTDSVVVNVQKATPTVTAIDQGGPYSGQVYAAGGSATGVGGAAVQGGFAFAYKDGQNQSLAGAPVWVGAYNVVATFTSTDPNYTNASSLALAFSIMPGPSGTIATDTPTFAWSPTAGAKHYALQVTSGKAVVLSLTNIATSTYTLTLAQALTPGQSYSWSVTPLDSKGKAIGSSGTLSFQVLPLGAPTAVGPTGNIVTDQPTFTWAAVTDAGHTPANHSILKVTDTTAKTTLTINNLAGTSYTLTPGQALTPGHSFTWSVTAVSSNGRATATGQSATFTIAALAAPTGLLFTSVNDTFLWQAVPDAGNYSLKVVDSATGKVVVNVSNVAGTTYALTSTQAKALKRGRGYTWYVAAFSTNGKASARSAGAKFTMA